jgi:hypothetical protein
MKPLIICTAILGLAFACPAAEAKGCIKGAIVGGIAGHLAGHGKVGAVAGCIIGHHEANKPGRQQNRPEDAAFHASGQSHLGGIDAPQSLRGRTSGRCSLTSWLP